MGNLLETRYLFGHEAREAKSGECLASSRAKDFAQIFSKLLLGGGSIGGGGALVTRGGGGHGNQ